MRNKKILIYNSNANYLTIGSCKKPDPFKSKKRGKLDAPGLLSNPKLKSSKNIDNICTNKRMKLLEVTKERYDGLKTREIPEYKFNHLINEKEAGSNKNQPSKEIYKEELFLSTKPSAVNKATQTSKDPGRKIPKFRFDDKSEKNNGNKANKKIFHEKNAAKDHSLNQPEEFDEDTILNELEKIVETEVLREFAKWENSHAIQKDKEMVVLELAENQ
ncbi:hypothetical protein COBT_001444 [Conglomerata obtusa]